MDADLKQYRPLARSMAYAMRSRLPPNVEIDDLIQAGMIGLYEALSRFDPEEDAKIETFARHRIQGAMLDELRRNDWMTRLERKRQRLITRAKTRLAHELGREPRASEVARELNLPLDEYQKLNGAVCGVSMVQLEDISPAEQGGLASSAPNPEELLQDKRRAEKVTSMLDGLPERDRQIMEMLYGEGEVPQRVAAEVLGVSESRVHQLHGAVIAKLRRRVGVSELPG